MRIRVYGTLRSVVGDKEIDLPTSAKSSARSVLERLLVAYPGLEKKLLREGDTLQGGVQIMVNGRSIQFLDGLDTPLEDSDQLALFPPIGGG